MDFILHITHAIVVINVGVDKVALFTDLPAPFGEPMTLDMRLPHGEGKAYVATNFPGIPIEVVDVTTAHKNIRPFSNPQGK